MSSAPHDIAAESSSAAHPQPDLPALPVPEPPVFVNPNNNNNANSEPFPAPFPAPARHASGTVGGISTEVMCMQFADKILITISQGGRLAQWVHVPLDQSNPTYADTSFLGGHGAGYGAGYDGSGGADGEEEEEEEEAKPDLLPLPHLTPRTILGGTVPERQVLGQLYATQIASSIASRDPEEKRMVVLGLGLEKVEKDSERAREAFFDVMELVLQVV
ncbi:hypothetical protein L228DRAFT_249149 [Xylona heveae TC161]|uniref:Proteasome assembly chaperone 3 n=1 Tax=Xylona heveae (strain CBS 132557 / TC161) TaxID=1328760 RepID=A0A165FT34_XYLHT|nr:hypothetical protein L228DRAFT_249149 [Xylona heveae TC161]KZF21340.1 hypothetical protein L228DRAFT_249149 [Xylona heveae TC161]